MSEPDLAYEQGLADERAAIVAYLQQDASNSGKLGHQCLENDDVSTAYELFAIETEVNNLAAAVERAAHLRSNDE